MGPRMHVSEDVMEWYYCIKNNTKFLGCTKRQRRDVEAYRDARLIQGKQKDCNFYHDLEIDLCSQNYRFSTFVIFVTGFLMRSI